MKINFKKIITISLKKLYNVRKLGKDRKYK